MSRNGGLFRGLAGLGAALLLLSAAWWLSGGSGPGLGQGLGQARGRAAAVAAVAAAPILAGWLTASADMAREAGVRPMPASIREALAGFVEPGVLERVRYRVGGGSPTSMQGLAFLHPHTRAVALDGVVVFRDQENAAKPRYWVHEIAHLEQIRRWGLEGFAVRYLRDATAVEGEAWALTDRYVAWELRRELETAADPLASARGGG